MQKFNRYENCPSDVDNGVRMPTDVLDAKTQTMTMKEVLGRLEDFDEAMRAKYPWTNRFVMGFPLPSWQRPLVWTAEQKTRFITSIWSGVDIGTYMINDVYEFEGGNEGDRYFKEFSEVVLDGQQRLNAIEGYVLDKFAVPDATGKPLYWSDLPRIERRRFGGFNFARATVRSWDEHQLRLAYDLRAFGGTAHTDEQRASRA